jgi:ketosteroid isomerase-like protein
MPQADQATTDLLIDYFQAMEVKDFDRLGAYYDDDITQTFANAPTITGRDTMLARMVDLLGKVKSLAHPLINVWQEDGGVVIFEVTSIWHFDDDTVIKINECSIFTIDDGKFTDQRIYVDNAPSTASSSRPADSTPRSCPASSSPAPPKASVSALPLPCSTSSPPNPAPGTPPARGPRILCPTARRQRRRPRCAAGPHGSPNDANTMDYYRITEVRIRRAVEHVVLQQFDGRRVFLQVSELIGEIHTRLRVGQVAVPFGICTEPSNVKAGGHACQCRLSRSDAGTGLHRSFRGIEGHVLCGLLTGRFEPLFQRGEVGRHLFLGSAADEERNKDLPYSVALEVNGDRQPRSFLGQWFHGEVHGRPDRPVDAVDAPRPGRIDVGDRRRGRPVRPADAPGGLALRSDLRGAGLVHVPLHDTVLPLIEPGGVGRVVEDFRCRAVDLGAGRDRWHRYSPPVNRAA